ncbi:UDP-glucuronosyl/UDP-glucosyltransferase, partial [Trema orientale]
VTKEGKGVVRPESLTWFQLTTESKHRVPLFQESGVVLGRAVKRNSIGSEKSSQRFLWVVRSLVSMATLGLPDPDLDSLLPNGFLERTKERGLAVKSWAP